MKTQVRNLVESAIMIALATVLSMIEIPMPFGGGITLLSMVPIILLSYRLGIKWGLASGFVFSVIQLMLGWANVGYAMAAGVEGIIVCIIFDYILPFTFLGLAGIFKDNKNSMKGIIIGATVVIVVRFIFHTISGGIIWYDLTKQWYADDPTNMVFMYSRWIYSIVYNGIYMGPELITTLLATPLIVKLLPQKR